jgi:hypothetical protein
MNAKKGLNQEATVNGDEDEKKVEQTLTRWDIKALELVEHYNKIDSKSLKTERDYDLMIEYNEKIIEIYENKEAFDHLKDVIETAAPVDDKCCIWESEWDSILTTSVAGWREIVKNPENWVSIENIFPRISYESLCRLFVISVGIDLAKHWFRSGIDDRRSAARYWLKDLDNLKAPAWNGLTEDMKHYAIYHVFENDPGEPAESIEEVLRGLYRGHPLREEGDPSFLPEIMHSLCSMGYIPSIKVRQLHDICNEAGDKKFLNKINKIISEYKEAYSGRSTYTCMQDLYGPTPDEQELIARVMAIFRKSGYLPAALPQILLSFESPPLFVAYPELEGEWEESSNNIKAETRNSRNERCSNDTTRNIPVNRERGRPETISIEELLGCYVPNQHIILYARGVRWIAREKNLDEDMVRAIVLVHEIGHWITHLLPKPGISRWPNKLYKRTDSNVHEGWAQLITWWVVEEIGGSIKDTFERINKMQSSKYKVFEQFKGHSAISITESLKRLRQLRYPARLEDWHKCIE